MRAPLTSYRCPHCGSDKVQQCTWTLLNSEARDREQTTYFCDDCAFKVDHVLEPGEPFNGQQQTAAPMKLSLLSDRYYRSGTATGD